MPCLVLEVLCLRLPRSLDEPVLQADRNGAGAGLAPSARTQKQVVCVPRAQTGPLHSPAAGGLH